MLSLCFDIGGTLVKRRRGFASCLLGSVPGNYHQVREHVCQCFLCGRYSLEEASNRFQHLTGFDARPLLEEFMSTEECRVSSVYQDVFPVLSRLRNRQIVTLSNAASWDVADLSQLGLEAAISKSFFSFMVGAAKPDIKCFRTVELSLNRQASQIAMIGDSFNEDVLGAKHAGWRTVFLTRERTPTSIQLDTADATVRNLWDLPAAIDALDRMSD